MDTTAGRQTAANELHQREKRATGPQPSPEIEAQTMIKELPQLKACFKNRVCQTDSFRDSKRYIAVAGVPEFVEGALFLCFFLLSLNLSSLKSFHSCDFRLILICHIQVHTYSHRKLRAQPTRIQVPTVWS